MMVSTLHGQFQEYESKSYEKPSNLHFGGTTIRSWPLFSFLHDLGFWDGLGVTFKNLYLHFLALRSIQTFKKFFLKMFTCKKIFYIETLNILH